MSQSISLAVVVSAQTDPLAKGLRGAAGMVDRFAAAAGKSNVFDFNPAVASLKDMRGSLRDVHAEAARTSSALGRVAKYGLAGAVSGGVAAGAMIGLDSLSALTGGVTDFVTDSIKMAAGVETTASGFEVLLGSMEKARGLMADLRGLAANSPLTFDAAAKGASQLLSFGIAGDQVVPTLRALGDIAGGDADKLGRLAQNYGQVAAAGRLTGSELNDFTRNGVPLMDALAKAMGKPTASIKELAEQGKIGFDDTVKAFKVLTEEGGLFFGRGDKYSRTFAGSLDRLKDGVEQLKTAFGTVLIEELGLAAAAADAEKFADWMRSGVGELRPAVRLLGDMGRAGAQLANEAARAAAGIARVGAEAIAAAVPGTKDLPDQITAVLKDLQNFKLDPVAIAQVGLALTDAMFEGLSVLNDAMKPIAAGLKEDLLDPFVATAKEVKGIVADIRSVIDAVKAARDQVGGVTGAVARVAGDRGGLSDRLGITIPDPGNALAAVQARANAGPKQREVDRLRDQLEFFDRAVSDPTAPADVMPLRHAQRADTAKQLAAAVAALDGPAAPDVRDDPFVRMLKGVSANREAFRAGVLERATAARDRQAADRLAAQTEKAAGFAADNFGPAAALAGGVFDATRRGTAAAKNPGLAVPNQIPPDVRAAAEAANKQFKNPLDALTDAVKTLDRAKAEGLVSDDVFARAVAERVRDAAQAGGLDRELRLPSVMEFGSQAAAATIANQQGATSVPGLLQKLVEGQARELEEARALVREFQAAGRPVIVPLAK